MKFLLQQLLLCFLISICWASPVLEIDPEFKSGYAEGDMLISPQSRNAVRYPWQKWPGCKIRYIIHCKDYDSEHLLSIQNNLRDITAATGLQFQQVLIPISPVLNFTCLPNGCFAGVGYRVQGTIINLEKHPVGIGCFRYGTVGHEISHALGKFHEQMRPDRDEWIKIIWQNIVPNMEGNFVKKLEQDVDTHNLPYDYQSNMHYGPYAFSVNGDKTIEVLRNGQIGQRDGFSDLDKIKLRKMYPNCKK